MTLPTLITVTGLIRDVNGPVAGRIVFSSDTLLRDEIGGGVVTPDEIVAVVGTDGLLSVQVPATDDPNFSPTGWTWEVRPHFPGWRTPFRAAIPYDMPDGVLDLGEVVATPPDGTEQLYALVNHTHEGGGGGGDITYGSVAAQTTYGATSSSGVATSVSRSDHRHGTPALPTPADIGAATSSHTHPYDPAGTAVGLISAHEADTTSVHGILNTANLIVESDSRLSNSRTPTAHAASHQDGGSDELALDGSQITGGTVGFARLPTGTGAAQVAVGNHTHEGGGGGGSTVRVAHGYITSGNVTPQTTATFAAITGGPTASIAAEVGDVVEFSWSALTDTVSGLFFDHCVIVGGSAVRFGSSGTATAAVEGDPSMYPDRLDFYPLNSLGMVVTVESGDLSGGNITFGLAVINPNGGGIVYAGTAFPFRWRIVNYGPSA